MRAYKLIIPLVAALLLVGCGTKKKAAHGEGPELPSAPTWNTCLIQNARAIVTMGGEKMSASVTMQTVRDSMLVISVMPVLGIEMMRVEATPKGVTAIDKIHSRYAFATYAEINKRLTPKLNWTVLQQLCSAELPTGDKRARLHYAFGEKQIELVVDYTPRMIDVPVRVTALPLKKYIKVDISKWL